MAKTNNILKALKLHTGSELRNLNGVHIKKLPSEKCQLTATDGGTLLQISMKKIELTLVVSIPSSKLSIDAESALIDKIKSDIMSNENIIIYVDNKGNIIASNDDASVYPDVEKCKPTKAFSFNQSPYIQFSFITLERVIKTFKLLGGVGKQHFFPHHWTGRIASNGQYLGPLARGYRVEDTEIYLLVMPLKIPVDREIV